jgi:hypothetical protein
MSSFVGILQVGETLKTIAQQNGCFVNDLRDINPRDKASEKVFQGYTDNGSAASK